MRTALKSILIISILLIYIATACQKFSHKAIFDRVESLMEEHPDSALLILEKINTSNIHSTEEKARYALLMSMALDKNYVDTTNFDVLQPAIDYYLKKGTPNEKLRTYYYQGRIYQNKGELDSAYNSYLKGIDNFPPADDSLTYARTLVTQAFMYHEFYDFESFIECHLKAANIYKRLYRKKFEYDCLLNALTGSLLLNDEIRVDSIIQLCGNFTNLDETEKRDLLWYRLAIAVKYGTDNEIRKLLHDHSDVMGDGIQGKLNLALAFNKLGDNIKAKEILDACGQRENSDDSLKYYSSSVRIYKGLNDYKNALSAYETFSRINDSLDYRKFDQKIKLIQENHRIELEAEKDARFKDRTIWGCTAGMTVLILIVVILILLVRNGKVKKDAAIQKTKATQLENANLKSEGERLTLINRNLQLEKDKTALEAENLAHKVEDLKIESNNLKNLLKSSEEIPEEVRKAVRTRVEMLNSLIADYISEKKRYEKPYETWVKELTENTALFMESNRMALRLSHPRFMEYLEQHNLTTAEIDYVCLYAIGLRGKEIGSYLKKPSHVNLSTVVRNKLGILKGETYLSTFVRNLLKNEVV